MSHNDQTLRFQLRPYGPEALIQHNARATYATAIISDPETGAVLAGQKFFWDGKPPKNFEDDSNPTATVQAMRWVRRRKEAAGRAEAIRQETERRERRRKAQQAVRQQRTK